MCHFLTFLFHRVLWDLSVIPTEHTLESETNTYTCLCTIFSNLMIAIYFSYFYIKIHAQYHSFLYVSFQSWFTWFWWSLIGAIGIKKKSVQFFVNTVTFYLHYVVFVFINKKKNIWLSRCYWVLFCCYLTIILPFIEVLSSLTKAFLNLLHADRPYTYIAKYIKRVMYMYAAQCFPHCVFKRKCLHRWNSNWMHIYYTST